MLIRTRRICGWLRCRISSLRLAAASVAAEKHRISGRLPSGRDPAAADQNASHRSEAWPWPPEAGLAAARARQLLATQVPWPPGRSRCSRGGLRDRRRRRWQVHTPRCPPAARPHLHLLCTPISLQAFRSLIQSCKSQQWRSQAALGTAPSATGTQGDAAAPG